MTAASSTSGCSTRRCASSQHDMFDSLRRWTRPADGGHAPAEQLPLELTIAAMDAAGVERGLIAAWYGPDGPLITNDEVARLRARRTRSGLSASPRSTCAARRRRARAAALRARARLARRCASCPGCGACRPTTAATTRCTSSASSSAFPSACRSGTPGRCVTSETGRPIPYLDDVALEFPELVIVGGHIGYPWTNEMIALATKYPNVYIDTSAYTATRFPPELRRVHARPRRARKVMFGTNYPMITAPRASRASTRLGARRRGAPSSSSPATPGACSVCRRLCQPRRWRAAPRHPGVVRVTQPGHGAAELSRLRQAVLLVHQARVGATYGPVFVEVEDSLRDWVITEDLAGKALVKEANVKGVDSTGGNEAATTPARLPGDTTPGWSICVVPQDSDGDRCSDTLEVLDLNGDRRVNSLDIGLLNKRFAGKILATTQSRRESSTSTKTGP